MLRFIYQQGSKRRKLVKILWYGSEFYRNGKHQLKNNQTPSIKNIANQIVQLILKGDY